MTVGELLDQLQIAARQLGRGADVTWINANQFADVKAARVWQRPTPETAWVWAGPVVVIDLDHN